MTEPTRTAPPNLTSRGLLAVGLAVVVNVAIVFATTASGAVAPFRPLSYPPVIALTVIGVVGATIVYGLLHRRRNHPPRDFAVIAAVVLGLSWIPDVTVLPSTPGATANGIAVLMALHLTTAGISYAVLTRGP